MPQPPIAILYPDRDTIVAEVRNPPYPGEHRRFGPFSSERTARSSLNRRFPGISIQVTARGSEATDAY